MEFPGLPAVVKWLKKNPDKAVVLKPDGTIAKTHKRVYNQNLIDQDKFELRMLGRDPSCYCAGARDGQEDVWAALPLNETATKHFTGEPQMNDDYKQRKRTVLELLKERAAARERNDPTKSLEDKRLEMVLVSQDTTGDEYESHRARMPCSN